MTPRTTGIVLIVYSLLSLGQRLAALHVPVLKLPFLGGSVLGYILVLLMLALGVRWLMKGERDWNISPLTLK